MFNSTPEYCLFYNSSNIALKAPLLLVTGHLTTLSISCRAGLLVTSSISFYVFWNALISPSLLDNFARYITSCLMRNLLLILMRIPCMWWVVSPCCFQIICVSLSLKSLIITCHGVSLFEFILFGAYEFLECLYLCFSSVWENFSHYLFKYSLCLFLSLFPLGTPTGFLTSIHFSQHFFFCFHCPIYKCVDSSACSNLFLNPCS